MYSYNYQEQRVLWAWLVSPLADYLRPPKQEPTPAKESFITWQPKLPIHQPYKSEIPMGAIGAFSHLS